jgi:hypothetical protein
MALSPFKNLFNHTVIHKLTLAAENEKGDFVMPAWMAGEARTMRPKTFTTAWIPALHAGMT